MKAHGFKLCCFFTSRGVCIDVNYILAYMMIGSYVSRVSTHYTFATVYHTRKDTVTKEMLVVE